MGFSVSGATAILFLGAFISFGVAYSAANDGFERVNEAYQEDVDESLTQYNTEIDVTSTAVANAGGDQYLVVNVTNEGTTSLSVPDTDLLVDGAYEEPGSMANVTVLGPDGSVSATGDGTDVWLPGETLRLNVSVTGTPTRVKVVTGPGVADAEVV